MFLIVSEFICEFYFFFTVQSEVNSKIQFNSRLFSHRHCIHFMHNLHILLFNTHIDEQERFYEWRQNDSIDNIIICKSQTFADTESHFSIDLFTVVQFLFSSLTLTLSQLNFFLFVLAVYLFLIRNMNIYREFFFSVGKEIP